MALPPSLQGLDLGPPLEDTPLAVLFEWLQIFHQNLSHLSPSSTNFFRAAWNRLEAATNVIDALGLFSPNEDEDDLSTDTLRYFLVPYYQAEALVHFASSGPADRWMNLSGAVKHYDEFLSRCSQYKLLGDVSRYSKVSPTGLGSPDNNSPWHGCSKYIGLSEWLESLAGMADFYFSVE